MSDAASLARWNRLHDLIKMLGASDSVEEVVQTLRISARMIVGADGIAIVRREGAMVHYVAEDAVGPLWTGRRFPIESCVSGIAMLAGRPVIIPDIYADRRVPHEFYRPTFVNSMAMFPVGVGEPVAAIGAYWARAGEIDEETVDLLATLSRSTAAVLDTLDAIDYVGRKTAQLNAML